MNFVSVSDVHIKEPGDKPDKLFEQFLGHKATQESEAIILLGDIFDLVVGGHQEYFNKHRILFEKLVELTKSGKKIHHFEGNHDFHFENLVNFIKKKFELPQDSWTYHSKPFLLNSEKILLAHGDEFEIENHTYQRYRRFIRSKGISFLANYVVPFKVVDGIGTNASKKSRERNDFRYSGEENQSEIKENFRKIFLRVSKEYKVNKLICGHSHCLDLFESKDGIYINNGYFPHTKTFISYKEGRFAFEKLESC